MVLDTEELFLLFNFISNFFCTYRVEEAGPFKQSRYTSIFGLFSGVIIVKFCIKIHIKRRAFSRVN